MKTAYSGTFEDCGWSLIPDFADTDELATIQSSLVAVFVQPRLSCTKRTGNDLIPLRWNDIAVASLLGSMSRIERIRRLVQANDLRWLSAYVTAKPPHSQPLWWHQDWWCWDHPISFKRATTQVAVLCYLTDTDKSNGALRVVPGSHHRSTPLHKQLPEPHGEEADRLPGDHPAMLDCVDQVTVSVRAGDAVVLDYRLLHGTHANDSAHRRDCILLSFITNWRTLPDELKAHYALHPALPQDGEVAAAAASNYAPLLPQFTGASASRNVNRRAPAAFHAR